MMPSLCCVSTSLGATGFAAALLVSVTAGALVAGGALVVGIALAAAATAAVPASDFLSNGIYGSLSPSEAWPRLYMENGTAALFFENDPAVPEIA
jgi:hypothetical protein